MRKFICLIVYDGKDWIIIKKEYFGWKGYVVVFILLFWFMDVLIFINEVIKNVFRIEVKLYFEIVLRELIVNVLIY